MRLIQIFFKNTGKSTAFERDAEVRNLCSSLGSRNPNCSLIHLMFNMYITDPTLTSVAVEKLEVDLLNQKARFTFKDGRGEGGGYEYSNVSKRAIANVLFNPDVSLGFWINNNCIHSERAYETSSTRDVAVRRLKRILAKEAELPSFV